MKVSYNWLKELVNLNVSGEDLAKEMSLYSIEVEEDYQMVKATNLVVGHVLEKKPHENSDHLNVCQVNLGDHVDQIVCGAPNVAAGQKVIVAIPGAKLPGIEIKKSVIRGVESNGMICSLAELGIENKYIPEEFAHGIYVLGDDAIPGTSALEYLGYDDYLIELGLTPNRMDLLSMLGVAKDVNAMYRLGLKELECEFTEIEKETKDEIDVEIQTEDCFSYYARCVEDVVIKDSPAFIKARLIASGVRPINNVVDITNYVLMLFGQPLHAFDKDVLGSKIIVRNAIDGEVTTTLDDIERKLECNDIVITDNKTENGRVVCLGGVMGCSNTEVTPNTKNIVLESAVFRPINIRKTSSRLGLRSESSVRFERGVDLNNSLNAVNYACYLLEKYADAKVLKGYVHKGTKHIEDKEFTLDAAYIQNYLGVDISLEEINDILNALSFNSTICDKEVKVLVPNRRLDVTIKEDLVEEIARIYGYHKLNETLPMMNTIGALTEEQQIRRKIKNLFTNLGMDEVVTYSLVSPKEAKECNIIKNEEQNDLALIYPLSEDHSVLRRSLVPSLLNVASYNQARKINDLAFFEVGKRYYYINEDLKPENIKEEMMLTGYLCGKGAGTTWKANLETIDFYYVKGLLNELFSSLKVEVNYKAFEEVPSELHPYRTAGIYLGNKLIGYFGALHPDYSKQHEVNGGYVFEVLLNPIFELTKKQMMYIPISKVPAVERDLALLISKDQPLGEIINAIKATDKKMITKVEIFDIFEDEKIGVDKASVAFRITLESNETLTEEIITGKINKILKSLEYRFHITLRG